MGRMTRRKKNKQLSEFELFLFGSALGMGVERKTQAIARKYLGYSLAELTILTLGIGMAGYYTGISLSYMIDGSEGVYNFRETVDDIVMAPARMLSGDTTADDVLMYKAGIVLDAVADTLGNPLGWDPLPNF